MKRGRAQEQDSIGPAGSPPPTNVIPAENETFGIKQGQSGTDAEDDREERGMEWNLSGSVRGGQRRLALAKEGGRTGPLSCLPLTDPRLCDAEVKSWHVAHSSYSLSLSRSPSPRINTFLVLLTNNKMFGYCEEFFNLKHMQYNKLLRLVSRWSVPLC